MAGTAHGHGHTSAGPGTYRGALSAYTSTSRVPAGAPPMLTSRNQGLTLVHFSAHPKPFWSRLPVSPCLIDWGEIMHPTYPT